MSPTRSRLLEQGREVWALAHAKDERSEKLRERGVEVVYGDLLDFGRVRAALDGVRRAYFVYPIRPGIPRGGFGRSGRSIRRVTSRLEVRAIAALPAPRPAV